MTENQSDHSPKGRAPVGGILLIIIGAILLLSNLGLFSFDIGDLWSLFILVPGIVLLATAFKTAHARGVVFPGIIVTGIGLFFLFQSLDLLPGTMGDWWPVFPTIVGLAFVGLYVFAVREKGLFIPAGILIFIGALFFLINFSLLPFDAWKLWPLILIAIGLSVIFQKHQSR